MIVSVLTLTNKTARTTTTKIALKGSRAVVLSTELSMDEVEMLVDEVNKVSKSVGPAEWPETNTKAGPGDFELVDED